MAQQKIITQPAILSFPALAKARAMDKEDGTPGEPKYSAMLVFPPGTNLAALDKAIEEVAIEAWGAGARAKLASGAIDNSLRGGEQAVSKGHAKGTRYLNARSKQQPGFVFAYPDPATGKPQVVPQDQVEATFYPGAKVRASITVFSYESGKMKKGISFGLNNVQLLDGTTPRLDNRKPAQDEFEVDPNAAPPSLADVDAE